MLLTREQRTALKKVYCRRDMGMSYMQFRRTVVMGYGCIMVQWCSMWLGIESDGYTHS
jgi:hypothetical protein